MKKERNIRDRNKAKIIELFATTENISDRLVAEFGVKRSKMILSRSGLPPCVTPPLRSRILQELGGKKYRKHRKKSKSVPKSVRKARRKEHYKKYLASPEWQKKRAEAFIYHGKRCHECGSEENLQVHHLTYERIFRERMTDLRVLCRDCHKAVHGIK